MDIGNTEQALAFETEALASETGLALASETETVASETQDSRFAGITVFWATMSYQDWWVESNGIRYQGRPGGSFIHPFCKMLVAAGHPDGVLRFRRDSDGMPCFWIWSIHKAGGVTMSEGQLDESQDVQPRVRTKKVRTPKAVKKVVKKVLKVRVRTPAPPENKFVYVTVADQRVRVNPKHREAFEVITNSPEKWDDEVHAKTRNYLVAATWVAVHNDKPVLTDFGQQVMQAAVLALADESRDVAAIEG